MRKVVIGISTLLIVGILSTPASACKREHLHHWHSVTQNAADVLSESGIPNADTIEWELCRLNNRETLVRCSGMDRVSDNDTWHTHWHPRHR